MQTELGTIKIYFGQVVDNEDPQQLLRCRVAIPGKTEQIEKEKLPWYYAWNGVGSLPNINDEVSVLIFDNNFATGFYGKTVINDSIQTQTNYRDYVEVFKKQTGDSDATIQYSLSNGIEIKNNNTGLTAEMLKLKLFCGSNAIAINEDTVKIGTGATQAALMGDDTIAWIKEMLALMQQIVQSMYGGFQTIMMAATPNPFTSAIGAALVPFIPGEVQFRTALMMIEAKLSQLQSKTLYHS